MQRRLALLRQATKATEGPSQQQAQAIQRSLKPTPRRTVTNFPPNVPALLADSLVQAIITAKTAANAKKAIQQAPKPVIEQALKQIPQSIDPKVLATIIVEAVSKGIVPPIDVIAPTLESSATAAPVTAVLTPDVLAKAVVEAVRKGLVPRLEVVAQVISAPTPAPAASKVVNTVPPEMLAKAVVEAVRKRLVPFTGAVVVATSRPVSASTAAKVASVVPPEILAKVIVMAFKKGFPIQSAAITAQPPELVGQAVQNTLPASGSLRNSVLSALRKFFGKMFGKDKMPTYGPNVQPNFVEPVKTGVNNQGRNTYNQTPPMPGYVLTTRNGKTGWYKNKGAAAAPIAPSGPTGPVGPTQPRNYSKMSIRELLDALRKYAEDKPSIIDALRKALEKAIRDIKYEYSKSRRARKLGDLLRLLPRNFNGRRNASTMVVDDIRDTRNGRELSNLRSNLGRIPNENIRQAFEEQSRRFKRNKGRETNRGTGGGRTPTRRYNESNTNYYRRVRNTGGERELLELMRRRRAARVGGAGAGPVGPVGGGNYGGGRGGGNVGGGGLPPPPPPPLPPNQRQAINNAGGVNKAMNTVVQVPGGAPEVAKAAEALNEAKGNTTYAIRVKGVSPAAVNAVQKLGGPNNTVHVLEGLNTMSKTHATRRRKAGTRRTKKVLRPRVAELNRVLEAVKKQRLISLAAHNVTKTHNIHPNDEKLKKYYKKVLKANILRTPFAKIAKRAAKKTK
jgi:hypothetical protein